MKPGDLVKFTKKRLDSLEDMYGSPMKGRGKIGIITTKCKFFSDCWYVKWPDTDPGVEIAAYEESLEIVSEAR